MEKDFQTFFNTLETREPKSGLSFGVLQRIELYKQRLARIRLAFLGVSTVIFAVAIVPAFLYTITAFSNTGFYQYVSLAFSDGTALLPYWKEFGLTLAESLPAFEISLLLAVIFAFLESFKLAIKNMPTAFYQLR